MNPICARCNREILPGQNVTFVGMSEEEIAEQRIIVSDELVIAHADDADCKGGDDG